jgi:hypothetical protein
MSEFKQHEQAMEVLLQWCLPERSESTAGQASCSTAISVLFCARAKCWLPLHNDVQPHAYALLS